MADKAKQVTIMCEGGLDTTENHLMLDVTKPGGASNIVNYEVGLYGGYRRIDGYVPYDATYTVVDSAGAEGAILGLSIYRTILQTDIIISARKQQGSSTYKFYSYNSGTGWTAYAPGFTLDSTNANGTVFKIRHAKFSFGGVNYIIFVDGVNSPSLFDGTTWYRLVSTNLGTSASPGGDQMIDYPKYVEVFKNHIFLSGDPDFKEVVCHSAPEDPFNYTAASGGGQLTMSSPVQNFKPFRDNLYVFGVDNIKKILEDNLTFVSQDVASNIGCVAPDSVIEINGDVLFLAQDGVRNISGTDKIGDVNLASISRQLQKYVNELQDGYDLTYLNAVVIKKKSQFRYFASLPQAGAIGVGLIGGIREGQNGLSWEFFKLNGIRTSVTEVDYIGDDETVLHGDYDGSIYKQESGTDFNGTPIISVYSTPFLTFGDPLIRKRPHKIYIFTKPEGSITASLSTKYDWNDTSVTNPMSYSGSIIQDGILYDTGVEYDSGALYSSEEIYPIVDIDLEGSFKSVRFTITTSATQNAHSIQGYIVEFTPEGTR